MKYAFDSRKRNGTQIAQFSGKVRELREVLRSVQGK